MNDTETSFGIKSWSESERPRERLLKEGCSRLSDAELVAVLIRNGMRGKDAVTLARELLACAGGLRGLFSLTESQLFKLKGLGPAKIAALRAANELGNRRLKEGLVGRNVLRDPESVVDYLYATLRDKQKEVFKVIFLNKANCILSEKDLFEGTVDETAVHIREIVQAALERHATGLILVHNHPSGRIQPSPEDREITRKIQTACESVSIRILDHLIVGDNQYFSFREQNLLER